MPRPIRIEYEHAIYHVMNRGRGHQFIFHGNEYYHNFLQTLEQACRRFGCIVHAYCLMGNHYHLLLETPLANLSRVMRHINGVYTQGYNRMQQTDGSLFRGRDKAILVSHDQYFLHVSRYIHLNPIETQVPLVERLEDYTWSSYPAYIGQAEAVDWLATDLTTQLLCQLLGTSTDWTTAYQTFVMQGNDDFTKKFHRSSKTSAVFGSDVFKSWVFDELMPQLKSETKTRTITPNLALAEVLSTVADFYQVTNSSLITSEHGRVAENLPRKIAVYLCQELTGQTQRQIADTFHLTNPCSVAYITHHIRVRKHQQIELNRQINQIMHHLINTKNETK